jgi:3-oxoacyl-[acyl-carrier protein] reductase
MDHTFQDKQAVAIIGGTGGIGSTLASILTGQGHQVYIGGRDQARLNDTSTRLNIHGQTLDATDFEDLAAFLVASQKDMQALTGVALCVGSILLKPAHQTTLEEWQQTLALNLTTAFATVRAAAMLMMGGGGSVVLLSSAAAQVGLVNHEAIAAAKAGVEGLTRAAAATYAPRGIRVNAVSPGLVDTPLAAGITANAASLKASEAMHPLGRIGRPEDVASALCWLLDPAQSWVTGQIIGVDGGLSRLRSKAGR